MSKSNNSETVTISKGEMQKQRANYANEKVYDKKDVVKAFSKVSVFKNLPTETRDYYTNSIWQALNTFVDLQRFNNYLDIVS